MTERKISQLAGKVLANRYELVKVIGDGGMGRVYRGVQLSTGGRVAIKIMDAWDHDAATVKRFRYEATTTASLSHPNTVRILDFGSDDDLFFLVMEYLPGTDLTRYLRREGQSDPFVAHVLLQTACSLAEAHSRGVVHRDIKPNNIMLLHHAGLPSFVKVIDFGIARAIGGPGNGTVGVLGTMGYIAPEQMKDGVQLDARTDLYSLGCVAYELLSGRLPFDGITHNSPPMDVLEAHLRGNPTPLSEAKPGVHPGLAELIMSMIRKRPDDRPPAAGELIDPLYALRRELSPELSSGYDRDADRAPAAPARQPSTPPPEEAEVEEVATPAGTAAYMSPASMITSSPPEKAAPVPSDAPFDDEDDDDVISSVGAHSQPPRARTSVDVDPEPDAPSEADAARTVRVSQPPVPPPSDAPASAATPASEPPDDSSAEAASADPESQPGDGQPEGDEWGFGDERPAPTGPVAVPASAPAQGGGSSVLSLVLGVVIGMIAMWALLK